MSTRNRSTVVASVFALSVVGFAGASANAIELTITIENLAPRNGVYFTPVWIAFHDGTFDTYNMGEAASPALERLAEDGNTSFIAEQFINSGSGDLEATVPGPNGPYAPADIRDFQINVDEMSLSSRYFSFATMLIPSNDAFFGNDDPTAYQLFDDEGNFLGAKIFTLGSMVLDAGTEVNTEAPEDTAFFGQQEPNTGPDENGVVHIHPGYKRRGEGGILDDPMFINADFIAPGYPVAQIRIVPEPTAAALLLVGGAMMLRRRRG